MPLAHDIVLALATALRSNSHGIPEVMEAALQYAAANPTRPTNDPDGVKAAFRTVLKMGYSYTPGAELWKPPLGASPQAEAEDFEEWHRQMVELIRRHAHASPFSVAREDVFRQLDHHLTWAGLHWREMGHVAALMLDKIPITTDAQLHSACIQYAQDLLSGYARDYAAAQARQRLGAA